MVEFTLNGETQQVDVAPDTPLLWVLRDHLGMTGTRFGCGVGQCGACTVHFNGTPMRSCQLPAGALAGAEITTIEALAHVVQEAWIEHQVPQCGYCQSGQLMAAAALLDKNPRPTDDDIDGWMTNLCRCATYPRIKAAIHAAAATLPEPEPEVPEEADDAGDTDGEGEE